MTLESPYRRRRLAPRCRLNHILELQAVPRVTTVRRRKWYVKLGLERRETVTVPIYHSLVKYSASPGNERTGI